MDMKSLMRQAQEMQNKMKKVEEEIANTEFEGSGGGGLVKLKKKRSRTSLPINLCLCTTSKT